MEKRVAVYNNNTGVIEIMSSLLAGEGLKMVAERTRYLKENPKGVGSMCKAMEELRVESYAEGKAEGVEIGKMEQAKNTALKLSRKGNSVEEIADLLGYDVDTVSSWIAPKAC